MYLHQTIKNEIVAALRARETLKLDTLRGVNALFINELVMHPELGVPGEVDILKDDAALALVKRSVKQRKDSIEQFEKGGRADLAEKEKAELAILETFMPKMMSRDEIRPLAEKKIAEAKAANGGVLDPKASGKLVGGLMRELAGRADGADVKAVIDELLKA